MLTRIFVHIVEISIALTPVLAVLLLLFGTRIGRRYSAGMRGLVWLVVAVRLLVPYNTDIGMGLRIDLAGREQHVEPVAMAAPPEEGERLLPAAIVPGQGGNAPESTAFVYRPEAVEEPVGQADTLLVVAVVWLAGAGLYLLAHLALHMRCMRRLRRWSEPVSEKRAREVFDVVRGEYRVARRVGLYQSDEVHSPMLVGLLRPRIVLPRAVCLDDKDLAIMLGHELCHLRRRDLWRKLVLLLAGALYWFHPLVHMVRRQASLDIEIACDGEVLGGANSLLRREYGFAVLSVLGGGSVCRSALSTQFFGGKKQMLHRFGQMVDTSPKRRGLLPVTLALVAVLGCGLFVGCGDPVKAEEQPPAVEQSQPVLEVSGSDEPLDESGEAAPLTMDLEAMEALFLSDLDYYQPLAAQVQNELAEIFERLEFREESFGEGAFAWPVPGFYSVSSSYGFRFGGSDFHTGMDIAGSNIYGADVVAAADGEVRFINTAYSTGMGYGMYVIVDHGGAVSTLYAQLSEVLVEEGQQVSAGQAIARVGSTGFSTGPHLHFEVRENGTHVDPTAYVMEEQDEADGGAGFIWPTAGGVAGASIYGGVNIDRPAGTPVYASRAGTVTDVRETMTGYGRCVIIDHGDGYSTLYGYADELYVQVGDEVTAGQTIASVGRSGNATDYQLYFELRYNGEAYNPADYLQAPEVA